MWDRGERAWPLAEAARGDRGTTVGRESTAGLGVQGAVRHEVADGEWTSCLEVRLMSKV